MLGGFCFTKTELAHVLCQLFSTSVRCPFNWSSRERYILAPYLFAMTMFFIILHSRKKSGKSASVSNSESRIQDVGTAAQMRPGGFIVQML